MVRKLLTINKMNFNKAARLERCTIIHQLHVDGSLTHAALYDIEEDYHEVVPLQYQAPVYVAEIQAAFMGIKHIILINTMKTIPTAVRRHINSTQTTPSCSTFLIGEEVVLNI